jgi:hypothetical protein
MLFYTRFISAYGTLMFATFLLSLVTQSQIKLGLVDYYGFPFVALVYAIVRYALEENPVLFARKPPSQPSSF